MEFIQECKIGLSFKGFINATQYTNQKRRKYLTISIQCRNVLDQIQVPFLVKKKKKERKKETFNKPGLEGKFCNLIKGFYEKSTTNNYVL